MKKFKRQTLTIIVIGIFAIAGCKKGSGGNFDHSKGAGGPFLGPDSVITGNISVSRTLGPDKVYKLNGVVYVTDGAKLTLKPGTVITTGEKVNYRVDPASSVLNAIAGVLVITRGSSIDAVGTPLQPIVFTSPNDIELRFAGNFGGVIILGKSTTNKPSYTVIEGLPRFDENGNALGVDVGYGGSVPADNSGRFQYVRIEYAGYKIATDVGINGLTMGGVGSGTTIDHVQVSYSACDAFAFFGGTVKPSYLLAIGNEDDDFDTTNGFTGTVSYAISLKDPNSTHSKSGVSADSNGIESDNDLVSDLTAAPRTKPTYVNFTILGYAPGNDASTLRAGSRWRRNTDLAVTNSIIAGYNVAAEFQSGAQNIATPGGFHDNSVHSYTSVFTNEALISPETVASSVRGVSNTVTTTADPIGFIGLGLSSSAANINPFFGNFSNYSFFNLRPRDATNTVGAVTRANFSNWNSGWVQFEPQYSFD